MNSRDRLGGIVHTYQKYDPAEFPSPTRPPPDVVSGAFEHMLAYGSLRELTAEELARDPRNDAVDIDAAPKSASHDPGAPRALPRVAQDAAEPSSGERSGTTR